MRTATRIVTLMLALSSLAVLAPPATAACTDREIVSATGGTTEVSLNDCRYQMYYVVERDGWTLVSGFCQYVDEVRVLGQPVPGTGQFVCVPGLGVPDVNQRTSDVPGVHTCLEARALGVNLVPSSVPCLSWCKPEAQILGATCYYYP